MRLSESALKPFFFFSFSFSFYHIVKYHVIVHVALKYAEKIVIAFLISIHTKTLSAMKNNK